MSRVISRVRVHCSKTMSSRSRPISLLGSSGGQLPQAGTPEMALPVSKEAGSVAIPVTHQSDRSPEKSAAFSNMPAIPAASVTPLTFHIETSA